MRCRITGLSGRADLNGKTCKLLKFNEEAGRWEAMCVDEGVRLKPANLKPLRPPPKPASCVLPEATATEEEEDCGVYVNAELNGERVAIDPGKLKKDFGKVVAKYKFDKGPQQDAIADFLTSGEASSVTAKEFAERFGTNEEDASIFLAWINVGVAFKEQYMDPNQEEADALARGAKDTKDFKGLNKASKKKMEGLLRGDAQARRAAAGVL